MTPCRALRYCTACRRPRQVDLTPHGLTVLHASTASFAQIVKQTKWKS